VDVLVMAEHGVRYPLWERLPLPGGGFGDPVDGLPGMSASLGDRLREWNAQLEHLAVTDFVWGSPAVEAAWEQQGLALAVELRAELGPGVTVWHRGLRGARRPVDEITAVHRNSVDVRIRPPVDDAALSALHARAFGNPTPGPPQPWSQRLARHSLTWVAAFVDGDALVGFVHAVWDGGAHAFLLDTVVDPAHQRRGIGATLVRTLAAEVTAAGCEWLHLDYEPHLTGFYREACGFRATDASLLRLR